MNICKGVIVGQKERLWKELLLLKKKRVYGNQMNKSIFK